MQNTICAAKSYDNSFYRCQITLIYSLNDGFPAYLRTIENPGPSKVYPDSQSPADKTFLKETENLLAETIKKPRP